jgi:hypothetical protein
VLECRGPVQDNVDGHALPAQPGGDRRGQVFDIFGDEHSHDLSRILLLPDYGLPGYGPRGYAAWIRPCQVASISPVSAAVTGLIPALAYNHSRSRTSTEGEGGQMSDAIIEVSELRKTLEGAYQELTRDAVEYRA